MSSQNALFAIAAIVLLVAALSLGFTYYSISNFKEGFLTGYVTANGTIYINITSAVAINFTTATISWGSGSVNSGTVYSVLSTSSDDVINGSWTPVASGFVVENIGNVNVSVNITGGKNATDFFGAGLAKDPLYQINVTNIEANSCTNASGFNLGQFYNITKAGLYACGNFTAQDARDTISIDVKLGIPNDAPATGVNLTDQIQVTALQSA